MLLACRKCDIARRVNDSCGRRAEQMGAHRPFGVRIRAAPLQPRRGRTDLSAACPAPRNRTPSSNDSAAGARRSAGAGRPRCASRAIASLVSRRSGIFGGLPGHSQRRWPNGSRSGPNSGIRCERPRARTRRCASGDGRFSSPTGMLSLRRMMGCVGVAAAARGPRRRRFLPIIRRSAPRSRPARPRRSRYS